LTAPTQRPRDCEPEHECQGDGPYREPDDDPPRAHERVVARVHAGHHVGFRLVDELVREPLQPVSQWGRLRQLQLPPFGGPAPPDQLHDTRDDPDELVVVGPQAPEQLDLVPGDELQAIQVVAELVEPAEDGVEAPILGDEQRSGDTVELACRVVLQLAVGGDLALQAWREAAGDESPRGPLRLEGADVGSLQDRPQRPLGRDRMFADELSVPRGEAAEVL
jgi:hypothetical protein